MTLVEIIAIVATGILLILCVFCVFAVLRNERKSIENSEAIKDIEKNLSAFGDSIKEQTDQLIEHMGKQQSDGISNRRLEALEEEIRQLAAVEEAAPAVPAPTVSAPVVTAPPEVAPPQIADISDSGLWEIEELDDEIEFDDLFRELEDMPTEISEEPVPPAAAEPQIPVQPQYEPPAAPQYEPPVAPQFEPEPETRLEPARYHQGYNIGRSGRKYTAEELNVLIRE